MCPELKLMPKSTNSQSSIYHDARSDVDLIEQGLDKILSTVDLSAELSPEEVNTSKRIRKKYGLDCPTDDSSICQRQSATGRDYTQEITTLHSTLQLLTRRFLEELVSGGTVENEHPLLEPFLAVLEIMLHHGWRGGVFLSRINIWSLVKRVGKSGASKNAVDNVRHFTSLKGSAGKLRAWIRLAMMNKCFTTDLTHLIDCEGSLISYRTWSDMDCLFLGNAMKNGLVLNLITFSHFWR
jgi:hypothetical protein